MVIMYNCRLGAVHHHLHNSQLLSVHSSMQNAKCNWSQLQPKTSTSIQEMVFMPGTEFVTQQVGIWFLHNFSSWILTHTFTNF